ncbi:MAG: response regulator transcription factor [Micropruina sp.]|uniref:LuxR C-terminal-related transcriptional regulator n=1 Tax=Micropruina sp. TaxID=2737536 RepID=UPI0039E5F138
MSTAVLDLRPSPEEAHTPRSDDTGTIGVLLAEPDRLVRTGLAMLVDAQPGLRVIGVTDSFAETVRRARDERPEVVLMDALLLADPDRIAAVRLIADAGSQVLVLAGRHDRQEMWPALLAGVRGYLLKDAAPAELTLAVRAVAAGGIWLDPTMAGDVLPELFRAQNAVAPPDGAGAPELTCREREVLRLIAHGLSNGEIAAHLMVAETTVKTHVGRILGKLGLRDRAQAVVAAYRRQLLAADDPLPPRAGIR